MKRFYDFPFDYGQTTFDFQAEGAQATMTQNHVLYMLNRTNEIFRYTGLPETVPAYILELFLQCNGNVCWYKVGDDLRVFVGGYGGLPDIYYRPTEYIIANPRLKESITAKVDVDCVVMKNDTMLMGLIPLFSRYATALTSNEVSMWLVSVMSRIQALIIVDSDQGKDSAEQYLKRVHEGKLGIIMDRSFNDEGGIKAQPYGTATAPNILKSLIENEQYLKGSLYNELGLNSMFNMKREAINEAESDMNVDVLLPFVDNMLKCRREGLEKVNAMFGTNITVEKNSAWEDVQETSEAYPDETGEDGERDEMQETTDPE